VPSNAAPGACDERQPVLRLPDRSKQGTVSLRALRRHGGLRITSDEPATLIGIAVAADIKVRPQQAVDRSGAVLRLMPRLLRRLGDRVASGRRTLIKLAFVQAWDGNGNGGGFSHNVRVVP
jgi:hypothetical protein